MEPSLIDFLQHIQAEINFIIKHTKGISFDELLDNELLNKALVRSFEIVGEASKKVPDEVRFKHPEFQWRGFAGIRDKLIHHYWGVDYAILWDAIVNEIPMAKEWIDVIIEEEKSKII